MGAQWVFYMLLQLSRPGVVEQQPMRIENQIVLSAREPNRQELQTRLGIDAELEILR